MIVDRLAEKAGDPVKPPKKPIESQMTSNETQKP